jgi:pyruvate dehydrogenase (quinone)
MVTDPSVPPLPPHITVKQAKAYLEALVKGDPDAIDVVKESARQIWAKVKA